MNDAQSVYCMITTRLVFDSLVVFAVIDKIDRESKVRIMHHEDRFNLNCWHILEFLLDKNIPGGGIL